MGELTEVAFKQTVYSKEVPNSIDHRYDKPAFSIYLSKLIIEKNINHEKIIGYSNTRRSSLSDYRNGNKLPKRKAVIDLAFVLELSLEETNNLLKYANYSELYARDKHDRIVIWCIINKKGNLNSRNIMAQEGFTDYLIENE